MAREVRQEVCKAVMAVTIDRFRCRAIRRKLSEMLVILLYMPCQMSQQSELRYHEALELLRKCLFPHVSFRGDRYENEAEGDEFREGGRAKCICESRSHTGVREKCRHCN